MGQKIEFNPEEWDFQAEDQLEPMQSEIILPDVFLEKYFKVPASFDAQEEFDVQEEFDAQDIEITAYIGGEKVYFNHQNTDHLASSPEEVAFRRQIEDLFELLELEKESGKTNGIRVYQTDSSPSRPWRFH